MSTRPKIRLPRLTGLFRPRSAPPRAVGVAAVAPKSRGREQASRQGRRLTPLGDRPNDEMRPSPRDRFKGADTLAPRIRYELGQRQELRAQAAHAGAKASRVTKDAPRRTAPQGIGGPVPTRTQLADRASRHPGRGRQLHTYPAPYEQQKASTTLPTVGRRSTKPHDARGMAPRPRAPLPGDVTPTGRMGGSRAGNDKPHPFFARKG